MKVHFDENNKTIATLYSRRKLKNNLYQFVYNGVVIGNVDMRKGLFIDKEGKEYYHIHAPKLAGTRNIMFNNCLTQEDLKLVFSLDDNVEDDYIIKKYIHYVKTLMYLVKTKKDNKGKTKAIVKEIDLKDLDNTLDNIEELVDNNENCFISESKNDDRIEKYLDLDYIVDNRLIDDLNKIIMDTYNCEYNPNELISLSENLDYFKRYIESALETIELQLQAYYEHDKEPLHPSNDEYDFYNYDPYNGLLDVKDPDNILYFEESKKEKEEEKEEVKEEVKANKMDLIKLRDEIKKYLINQDEALRRVLTEIARMDIKGNENNKGILLLGDSGVGKTYLMELLAKNLNVPILIIDSTQLTVPGYVGKDIQEYLWDLYEKCDKDLDKCENAIIFFDEIDKKGSNRKSDTSGQGVLNVLLKFLDGTTYDVCKDTRKSENIVKMNTSKMKVIAGGAFTDVFVKDKKTSIGFNPTSIEEVNTIPDSDTFVQKAFMTHEFMGRFPIRIKLNSHTEDSFKEILKESDSSTLKEEKKAFEKLGIKLSVTDEFVKLASQNALKLKTGVRGLMGCIEEATWMAFEDCYNNPDKYEEIILTEETLTDPANYQKVLKK